MEYQVDETDIIGNISKEFEMKNLLAEAGRCLSCYDAPCQASCPAAIPIPEFIRSIISGNLRRAATLLRSANPIIDVCGEVCPAEVFCQAVCTRNKIDGPVAIRYLHAYASKLRIATDRQAATAKSRVAIIGSGPAGIACAVKLAEFGIAVECFEKHEERGGVPALYIPEFRLSKSALKLDIDYAASVGVKFLTGCPIASPFPLLQDYDAVFVATGLPKSKKSGIAGEELDGVLGCLEFLSRTKSDKNISLVGKRVVVVGGGNVSLDVAASAAALGADEVRLLYRRGPAEMKVWRSELDNALARGVIIDYLTTPLRFEGENGQLKTVICAKTVITEKVDSSNRKIPAVIESTAYRIKADVVVVAVGLYSDYIDSVSIRPDFSTSVNGLFAGGDFARGEGTIVEAVRDGKLAAKAIIKYIEGLRK